MSQRLRAFWLERSGRERQMLLVMITLAVVILAWLAVIRPVNMARADANARLDLATGDAAQIAAASAALRSIRPPPPRADPLASVVAKTSADVGFQISRLDPQGEDKIAIAMSAARSPALFAWFATLEQQGVIVDKLSLRTNSDTTLAVEGVLRTQGR